MNRILVDTNVYISAVVFVGRPALVLQIADSLGIELAVSAELEAEFRETLGRQIRVAGRSYRRSLRAAVGAGALG